MIRIWKNTGNFKLKHRESRKTSKNPCPCPKIWFPQKHHQKGCHESIILEALKVIHAPYMLPPPKFNSSPLKNDTWNTGFLLGWHNFTYVKPPGSTLPTYFNKIVPMETYISCTCLWDFLPTNLWGSGIFRHRRRDIIIIIVFISISIFISIFISTNCHTIINHLIHLPAVRVETEKSHQSVHKIPIYKCQGFSGCVRTT